MKRSTPKDWTQRVIQRFKDGETVADLMEAFLEPSSVIEGIIRLAMQRHEEEF